MATWRKPAERPADELAPAAERGEHWWPVALAILVVAGLHVALPARWSHSSSPGPSTSC